MSHHLAELKRLQAATTRSKVRAVMVEIDRELSISPNRRYPHNGGRLTQREICLRAGISPSTIKQEAQLELRAEIQTFLQRWRLVEVESGDDAGEVLRGQKSVQAYEMAFAVLAADVRVLLHRASNAEEKLRQAQNEMLERDAQITELKVSLASLRETLSALRTDIVIDLRTR